MSSLSTRVALLLFTSGFCGLVYQMAWLRLLRLVFGASTAASAAVLAIFMGGLGLGSLLLGPRADRARNPLGLYARLELGIALAAAASPLLIALVRRAYIALGGTAALGATAGTGARLLLAAAVLGIPTFLMGGTLPATVRAVTEATDAGRRTVGLLYAVNTLGAVVGTIATVFWALEVEGIRRTLWLAALVNLLVAIIARAMARSWQPSEAPGEPRSHEPSDEQPSDEPQVATAPPPAFGPAVALPFVFGAAAAVGFAFFLMELVWYRMLAPILGGTSYTFGMILAVALAGIGAGGLIYSMGSRRRRPTLVGFAATCAAEALFLILPFALGDRLAFLALGLQGLDAAGFGGLVLEWMVVTVLVVFPPALVAGYQFPLLVGVVGEGRRHLGREVGLTYAWNTLGAIAGSIAGGFGLLPLLTAPGTWRWTAVGLAILAGAAVALGVVRGHRWPQTLVAPPRRAAMVAVLLLVGVSFVLAAARGPSAFWRHGGIGGRRAERTFRGPNDLRAAIRADRAHLVWEAEGRESSIGLIQGAGYTFMVNGKTDGSALGDAPTQVLGGLVGSMLHPHPRHALVIGLGTGSTAGWLADVPGMERVDVVELEPSVVGVARACAPVNRDVLDRDNVELILGDGREFLLTTDRRYDVIFSEPSNPYRAGISSLFTREFYRAATERLTEDGLFLQWLQGYEVDASVVRTAYATLASVFPAVESWRTHRRDLLLVAGRAPLVHDWQRVARRAAEEPYRDALERVWGVSGAAGFYSGFLAGPDLAEAMARAASERGEPINTDDHPVIEYGFVRNLGRRGLFKISELTGLAHRLGADRPAWGEPPEGDTAGDPAIWRRVEEAASARGVFLGDAPEVPDGVGAAFRARAAARRAYESGDLAGARAAWSRQDAPAHYPADLLLVAESLAAAGDPATPEAAERLARVLPTEAEAVRALYRAERGEWSDAASHLEAFLERLRSHPWLHEEIEQRTFRLMTRVGAQDPVLAERLFRATAQPFAAGVAEMPRRLARLGLAQQAGFRKHCVEGFAALEPYVPWRGPLLETRLRCYMDNQSPLVERARRELLEWYHAEPPRLDAGI